MELLVTIIIIGALTSMGIVGVINVQNRMNEQALDSKKNAILSAAEIFAAKNSNKIRKEYGTETPSICNEGIGCKTSSLGLCLEYECQMTVGNLVALRGYNEENRNNVSNNTQCSVSNPVNNSCLDSMIIKIYLHGRINSASAEFKENGE